MTEPVHAPPPGPPAAAFQKPRLARRVAANLMRVLPVRAYGALVPRRAIGLCYHLAAPGDLPHIRPLYDYKTPEQLEADLVYLKRNFRVASYPEVEAGTAGPNAVLITFDDGLAECWTHVRPLLLEHGLPAVFFVSPPHLDNRELFSFEKAALILSALEGMSPAARAAAVRAFGHTAFPSFALWLTSWIRALDADGEARLEELCRAVGLDTAAYLAAARPHLTGEQVVAMAGEGFTIGGHGLRHRALGNFPDEVVAEEILASCSWVAERTGAARVPFAFPFDADGVRRELLERLRRENPWLGLLFGTGNLRTDRDFLVNRLIVDGPGRVAGASNLGGHLRGAYLSELARRVRG